jgi:hypothetical protein
MRHNNKNKNRLETNLVAKLETMGYEPDVSKYNPEAYQNFGGV